MKDIMSPSMRLPVHQEVCDFLLSSWACYSISSSPSQIMVMLEYMFPFTFFFFFIKQKIFKKTAPDLKLNYEVFVHNHLPCRDWSIQVFTFCCLPIEGWIRGPAHADLAGPIRIEGPQWIIRLAVKRIFQRGWVYLWPSWKIIIIMKLKSDKL